MAPPYPRRPIAKDRFAALFPTLKAQAYHDPPPRGSGSHTIRTIAWSPTGHLIATGSADRTLRVWNPEKPQVKTSTELKGHLGAVEKVAWNPIKEAELASVSSDGTCKFWDVRNKTCTATVQLGGEGLTIAWAGDGSVVMVGSTVRKEGADYLVPITIHPTPTASTPIQQPLQTNQVTFNHSTPPTYLLLTRGDGSITIATYPSLQTIHTLHAHTSSCFSLALSPTARYLAIGGSDALISLYDTTDWVCKRSLTSATGPVKSVGFSFDGSFVVGGDDEGKTLEVAHVESGECVGKIGTGGGAGVVAWHPGRYWIAYAGEGGGLKILGAAGGQMYPAPYVPFRSRNNGLSQQQFHQLLQFLRGPAHGKVQNMELLEQLLARKLEQFHSTEVEISGEGRDRLARPGGRADANLGLILHVQSEDDVLGGFWDSRSATISLLLEKGIHETFAFGYSREDSPSA